MSDVDRDLAKGTLKIAIRRMVKEHPFHAHLLSPDSLICDPEVETMGVTIRGGRIVFPYAPDFVLRCSYDELIGVFQHEVNHLLFGHVLADPAQYPDSQARVIAEEVTANEWVTAPLPGRPLTLDQFPALRPFDDTDARYAYLARKTADLEQKTIPAGPRTAAAGRNSGPRGPKSGRHGPKSGPRGPESGSVGAESSLSPPGLDGVATLDNHEIWCEAGENPVLGRLIIASAAQKARQAMDSSQWGALPDGFREKINDLVAGHSPGAETEDLSDNKLGTTVDWRSQLRRYIAQSAVPCPVFHRPPRRMPDLIGVMPAQYRVAVKPAVMAVIDTSASMIVPLLEIIDAELQRLARDYLVTVVECDAEIQCCYPYRGKLKMVHGRGGTDLRPPFESRVLAKICPDVIVYFTDGDGPAPDRPPRPPVVWCLTPFGSRPALWGREIRLATS